MLVSRSADIRQQNLSVDEKWASLHDTRTARIVRNKDLFEVSRVNCPVSGPSLP